MSPAIVSFNNVSFSLVHGLHCHRYNGIHCPTGPQIGLRPPTALSIHSLHTGEVCGLLEPTSSFSTTAFCCYMGVVPNVLSILVPSQHLLRGSVTPYQTLSVRACCYKGLWWTITSLSCETKEANKKHNFPRGEESRLEPNVLKISQAGCCGRRSPATPPPPQIDSSSPWVTPASQRAGQPSTWETHPSRGKRARFWWETPQFFVERAPHPWAPQPLLVARPRSPWGVLPSVEAPRPHPSERHSCPKGRLFNK